MDDSIKEEILFNMVVRIISLENILIEKNIISNTEIQKEIEKTSSVVLKSIVDNVMEQALKNKQTDKLIIDQSIVKKNIN